MTMRTRRYRAEDGEIDLVMQDGETIVFVEVKARPQSRAGQGMLAVTPAKQRRICHAAMHYLLENDCMDVPARFDVVEITPRRADSCKKCVYGKHVKQKPNSERPISGVTR